MQVIERGLSLLRAGAFLPAHECFEAAFRDAQGNSRILLHALAQFSAGHVQLSLGRARAAVRTWDKACLKLSSLGLAPTALVEQLAAFRQTLQISAEGPRFIELATLPARETWPCPDPQMFW